MRLLLGGRVRLAALFAVALFALAAFPAGASGPGTNGKILFGQVFPNYGVTINPDGSNPIAIGPVDSTTCDTWSPDSSKVLCNLWSPEGVQPATANPDGSGFTLLNSNLPLDLFCLNWSPEGARLLCHSEGMANPGDAGLYTVRSADASDLVRVSTSLPGGFDNGYGYSPDGSRILYAQFDSNDHATLFSVRPDGSDPVQLSPPELSIIDLGFFDRVGADWSPDGSRVVFAASRPGGRFNSAVFVVNADGTGLHQITPSGIGGVSAQWSPNGAMIAFTSGCCGLPQAWVVHPDGSGLRLVTTAVNRDFFVTPVWSPDSTKLVLNKIDRSNQASVWTANLDGSGLVHLADTPQPSILDWGSAPAN
jgi:hypothetical protein